MTEARNIAGVMGRGFRTLVCGGREFTDRRWVFAVLDHFHERSGITVLIHGAAKGADSLAGEWAHERGIACVEVPADWQKHGRSAGPIRNQRMLDECQPDGVIAFPGGKGTDHMRKIASAAGLRIYEPGPDPQATLPPSCIRKPAATESDNG